MIFTAATDEKTLLVFSTAEKAIAYCEGIDVEAGGWLFWNELGHALAPEFLTPNNRSRFTVCSGNYHLVPAPLKHSLTEALVWLGGIESNPHFTNLEAVRAYLTESVSLPSMTPN
jgi:hypothetical protein